MKSSENKVYLFWDNSNIFVPAKFAAAKFGDAAADRSVRIQFDHLYQLAQAGRTVDAAYCVGSLPRQLDLVWGRLRDLGIAVETFERGSGSGTEQAVDQALQVRMLRTLSDVRPPGVAVLMTGDGAGYDEGVGFHRDLERMYRSGWGVEVISWESACNQQMKSWAESVGVFVPLERYYRQVTFIEGGRPSEALSLKSRRRAAPACTAS